MSRKRCKCLAKFLNLAEETLVNYKPVIRPMELAEMIKF